MAISGLGAALQKIEQRRRERQGASEKMYQVAQDMGRSIGDLRTNMGEDITRYENQQKELMAAEALKAMVPLLDKQAVVTDETTGRPTSLEDRFREAEERVKRNQMETMELRRGEDNGQNAPIGTAEAGPPGRPAPIGAYNPENMQGVFAREGLDVKREAYRQAPRKSEQDLFVPEELKHSSLNQPQAEQLYEAPPEGPLRHITEEAMSIMAKRIAEKSGMDEARAYGFAFKQLESLKAAKLEKIRKAEEVQRTKETHASTQRQSRLTYEIGVEGLELDRAQREGFDRFASAMGRQPDRMVEMEPGTEVYEYWDQVSRAAGVKGGIQHLKDLKKKDPDAYEEEMSRLKAELAIRMASASQAATQAGDKLKNPEKFMRSLMFGKKANAEAKQYRGTAKENEDINNTKAALYEAQDFIVEAADVFSRLDEAEVLIQSLNRGGEVSERAKDGLRGIYSALGLTDQEIEGALTETAPGRMASQSLRSLLSKGITRRIKEMSGAAFSEKELERHKEYFPNTESNQDPRMLKLKILIWYDMVLIDAKRKGKIYSNVASASSLRKMTSGMPSSGLTSIRQSYSPAEIRKAMAELKSRGAPMNLLNEAVNQDGQGAESPASDLPPVDSLPEEED